jgi:hypothetical protein
MNGEGADEPDGDEDALDKPGRDVADSSDLALALEDRVRHHGRSDIGDDEEDLQRRCSSYAVVGSAPAPVISPGSSRMRA